MPTYQRTPEFLRDLSKLTPAQRERLQAAVTEFIHDLRVGAFRPGLRVKRLRTRPGVWEMTWAPDGRALFAYGEPIREGDAHIIWLRIGTHEIFE